MSISYNDIAKQSIEHQIEALAELKKALGAEFDQAIEKMLGIKGRVIVSGMGKSGHIAKKIAASLASTGTPAIFIHPAEAGHGDLGMITTDDMVILLSNSGETAELQAIIDYCLRFSIHLIAMTRNANSTLGKASQICLTVPKVPESFGLPAPTTSSTMMLVLGDAIAVTLMKARNFSEDDFSIFHPGGNLGARLKKVRDFMHTSTELPLVMENENIDKALQIMSLKGLGILGILSNEGTLLGVLSDGDIRRNLEQLKRGCSLLDIITTTPISTTEDEFLSKSIKLMHDRRITSLFVLRDSKPVGIIHIHDLIDAGVV